MEKITEEKIKWFWEQCGLSPIEMRYGYWDDGGHFCEMQSNPYSKGKQEHHHEEQCYLVSKGKYGEYWEIVPPIDLNSLFQYAVPRVINILMAEQECSEELAYDILFKKWGQIGHDADALFRAIFKALGGRQ